MQESRERSIRIVDKVQERKLNTLIHILMAYYILYRMPAVTYYVNTYFSMAMLVALVVCIFVRGSVRLYAGGRYFVVSAIFFLIVIVDKVMQDGQIMYQLWDAFLECMPLFIGFLLINYKMEETIRVVVPMIVVFYVITCITTYNGLQIYPMASRDMASGLYSGVSYTRINIGGFDFIYSLVVIHPMFVFLLRTKKHTVLAILMSMLMGICVVESKYTLAAVTFVLSAMAYLLPIKDVERKRKWMIPKIAVVLVVIFLVAPSVLMYLSEQEFLGSSADKLQDVARILRGEAAQSSDTFSRQRVYRESWETFLEYPIFGCRFFTADPVGGHSFFLDMMAKWGILGIGIVVAIVTAVFKWYQGEFGRTNAYYHILLSLGLSLIVAMVNPVFWTFELGIMVPLFAYNALYIPQKEHIHWRFRIKIKWR